MLARRRLLALIAAAALAPPVAAQTPAPDAPITVTGVRETPATIHQHAVDFVHATGVTSEVESVARWAEPVCPRAFGLTDPAAVMLVEAKLRRVAADAGISAASAPCRANIAVVFVANAGAAIRDLVNRAPRQFGTLRPAAVATLTNGTAPIRWWSISEVRDKDSLVGVGTPTPGLVGLGFTQRSDGDIGTVDHYNNSLISTEDVRVLRAATVVVDVTRTDGLPLSAVAAYAAMVAFAEIRPGASPPDSVLGLFAGGPVLRSPTAWDLSFLRALYHLPLDREARRQRGQLVTGLVAAVRP